MVLIYLNEEDYKNVRTKQDVTSSCNQATQLTQENIEFLKSKGFKVRQQGKQ